MKSFSFNDAQIETIRIAVYKMNDLNEIDERIASEIIEIIGDFQIES